MAIDKGQPWGTAAPMPADGLVVRSDREARDAVEEARRRGRPLPVLGLVGGDLCRTLGGGRDPGRLRSPEAMTFNVDVGEALIDGKFHYFVAHLLAHTRAWRRSFAAMNAQWYGDWDLGPRSHPGDGLLDTYDARLALADLLKVRSRLRHGSHLPHPGIRERRVAALQLDFERPLPVELDGGSVGKARALSIRVHPDALRVVV